MSFSPVDIVNIRGDIKCLKSQFNDMISKFDEIIVTIDSLEYFLSHFDDVIIHDPIEDLPF